MDGIAEVYAKSLFAVAKERDQLDAVQKQLGEFVDAFDQQPDFAVFFFTPYFATQEKKAGLKKAVEGALPTFQNFLELLIEKHRMPVIFRIRRAFEALWRREHRLLSVQVTSATELSAETVTSLGEEIEHKTGERVELKQVVDPSILGGLILRVGNSIADASVKQQLELLRRNITMQVGY